MSWDAPPVWARDATDRDDGVYGAPGGSHGPLGVRGRGLKRAGVAVDEIGHGSPTVRGRGLKRSEKTVVFAVRVVAHRAWAWVETYSTKPTPLFYGGRPPCVGVG